MAQQPKFEVRPVTQRHVIYFTGNVQGVGFRVDTQIFAKVYNLVGNVSNLPNGQVMVVAEGLTAQIGYMLIDLLTAFAGHITEIELTIEPGIVPGCSSFEIVGLTEEEQACLDSQ